VSNDKSISLMFEALSFYWPSFDGIVHCIANSEKKFLNGDYIETITRKGFHKVHNISSYSFLALTKACRSMLKRYSSLITLTYIGSKKVIPNYNIMGVAKASLEANMRYMSHYMKKKFIRVNAISVPPMVTSSSSIISGFRSIYNDYKVNASINNLVTSYDIGNVAVFLASNLSSSITGQVIYTDNGFGLRKL